MIPNNDDLSFSGIVNAIQGDKKTGIKLLLEIAEHIEQQEDLLFDANKKVQQLENEIRTCEGGIAHTAKYLHDHFAEELPIIIKKGDKIYHIEWDGRFTSSTLSFNYED